MHMFSSLANTSLDDQHSNVLTHSFFLSHLSLAIFGRFSSSKWSKYIYFDYKVNFYVVFFFVKNVKIPTSFTLFAGFWIVVLKILSLSQFMKNSTQTLNSIDVSSWSIYSLVFFFISLKKIEHTLFTSAKCYGRFLCVCYVMF